MKGKALRGRGGGQLWKYSNIFPKRQAKDTKSLLSDMMVFASDSSLIVRNTSRKHQGFSQISRRVISVQNLKRLWCYSVNKYNKIIEKKIGISIANYAQPSYNYITFLLETLNITFLCVSRKLYVNVYRRTNAFLSYLP